MHVPAQQQLKAYAAAMDKTLKAFDNCKEWADLIWFLGKVHKLLQSFPSHRAVPFKTIFAKRLAQCLNPALPSGVHAKAIEVYDLAFFNMGPIVLARDLVLYSAGLFPLLALAASPVKPLLLQLYEKHLNSGNHGSARNRLAAAHTTQRRVALNRDITGTPCSRHHLLTFNVNATRHVGLADSV
ncbi:hypothetical protein CAOG_03688 [Capsaspora owczarzaki ATCC 30864]|uniref:hypothetical protein n=1 Tax=Capsaspora owczarzaki (strain ATCC 30864) TaxID=595528 RepID=UPI0001FE264C|nr:hypothetical protein CAOG_03688 [Capsaspora owczarzaki ATCC 30864]|eukprot:XP_004363416.1 hypothetical protein CAOG_03688 [Capsaspora owczarzaki ATCC 30864]